MLDDLPNCEIVNAAWRDDQRPLGPGTRRRFPFLTPSASGGVRPLLFLEIANGRDPRRKQIVPALIDSGAHVSIAPRSLGEQLGLSFSAGRARAKTSGVGGQSGAVFEHEVRLSVLAHHPIPDPHDIVFGPMVFPLRFLAGDIPFVLLGQQDFLARFAYTQILGRGFFELQWLTD